MHELVIGIAENVERQDFVSIFMDLMKLTCVVSR